MKKFLKYALGISGLILSLSVTALIVLYFNAALQTYVAKKVAASYAPEASFQSVDVKNSTFKISKLAYVLGNSDKLYVESAELEYSLSNLIFGSALNVKTASIKGAVYEFSKKSDTPVVGSGGVSSTSPSAPLPQTGASAPQEVKIEEAKKTEFALPIAINIENLDLDLTVKFADGKVLAIKNQLVGFDMPLGKLPVSGRLDLLASLEEKGADKKSISFASTVSKADNAKNLNLRAACKYNGKDLFLVDALLDNSYTEIAGKLELKAEDKDIAEFLPQGVLPKFSVLIFSNFSFNIHKNSLALQGKFDGSFSEFSKLHSSLSAISGVKASGEFDVSKSAENVSVKKLSALLIESGKTNISLDLIKELNFSLDKLDTLPDGKLLSLGVRALSIDTINALAGSKLPVSFNDIFADFVLEKTPNVNEVYVATLKPIQLRAITVSSAENLALSNFDLDVSAVAKLSEKGLSNLNLSLSTPTEDKLSAALDVKIDGAKTLIKSVLDGSLTPLIKSIPNALAFEKESLFANVSALINLENNEPKNIVLDAKVLSKNKVEFLNLHFENFKGKLVADNFPVALIAVLAPNLSGESFSANIDFTSAPYAQALKDFSLDGSFSTRSISYQHSAEVYWKDLNSKAKFALVSKEGLMNFKLESLDAGSSKGTYLKGNLSAVFDSNKNILNSAHLEASAVLPAILAQKMLNGFDNVSRGNAEISADYAPNKISAKCHLNSLSARAPSGEIDKVALEIDAKFNEDFSNINSDISFSSNSALGQSDAKLKFIKDKISSADFSSGKLIIDDIILLSKLFKNPVADVVKPTPASPASASKSTPTTASRMPSAKVYGTEKSTQISTAKDTKAFWDFEMPININAKISSAIMAAKPLLTDFSGSASILQNEFSIKSAKGKIHGANAELDCKLTFNPSAKKCYTLASSALKISELPIKDFFDNPKPIIICNLNVNANLSGTGDSMEDLLNGIYGSASLSSGQGVLHLLDEKTAQGSIASVAGQGLKIAGGILGNRVKELSGLGDITMLFTKLDFSSLNFEISRNNTDFNININKSEIFATDFILKASGNIAYDANKSILDQTINIPVKMYVKEGNMRTTLASTGLATTKSELENYYAGPSFEVYGTLNNPQNNLMDALSVGAKKGLNNIINNIIK